MSEIIRIPNIENYTQEFVNGELVLTPKKHTNIPYEAFNIALEYYYMGKLSEFYECEITELSENCERREHFKHHVARICQIKCILRKRFAKKFEDNLWSELYEEFNNNFN